MTKEVRRISQEFATDLARFFKQIVDRHEAVIVEDEDGKEIIAGPLSRTSPKPPLSDEDYRAFRSAFGGWADVDTDTLKKEIYKSRKSSRPSVSL